MNQVIEEIKPMVPEEQLQTQKTGYPAGGNKESSKNQNLEISNWLRSIGLDCYIESFVKENIDIYSLPDLDDEHLKELGVSVGHRIRFKKAIESLKLAMPVDDSPIEYVCKVIVVGDIGTGKTSLIQRYTNGIFDKGYKATIGVDFCLKEIKWNRNTSVSVQLWDIAGQERFANLTRMYYKEARGAFVVFDVFREKTFEAVLKWKADIDSKVTLPNGRVIPVILLANKCDLTDKHIDLDEFCKKYGFDKWFLTSAKEDIGITEASRYLVQTILTNDESYSKEQSNTTDSNGGTLLLHQQNNTPKTTNTLGCCT